MQYITISHHKPTISFSPLDYGRVRPTDQRSSLRGGRGWSRLGHVPQCRSQTDRSGRPKAGERTVLPYVNPHSHVLLTRIVLGLLIVSVKGETSTFITAGSSENVAALNINV